MILPSAAGPMLWYGLRPSETYLGTDSGAGLGDQRGKELSLGRGEFMERVLGFCGSGINTLARVLEPGPVHCQNGFLKF